jgi:hypothetical protein
MDNSNISGQSYKNFYDTLFMLWCNAFWEAFPTMSNLYEYVKYFSLYFIY